MCVCVCVCVCAHMRVHACTRAGGGWQVSASIALAGVEPITLVIPEQQVFVLCLVFLALALSQPGHQTKDAERLDGLMKDI